MLPKHVSAIRHEIASDQNSLYLPMIQTTPILLLDVFVTNYKLCCQSIQGTAKNISQKLVFNPTILLEFENPTTHETQQLTITTILSYTFPGQTNFVNKSIGLAELGVVSARMISFTAVTHSDFVVLNTVSSTPSFTTTLITLTNPSAVTITEISLAYWPALYLYPTPELLHLSIPPDGSVSILRSFYIGNPPPPDIEIPPTQVMAYGRP